MDVRDMLIHLSLSIATLAVRNNDRVTVCNVDRLTNIAAL